MKVSFTITQIRKGGLKQYHKYCLAYYLLLGIVIIEKLETSVKEFAS